MKGKKKESKIKKWKEQREQIDKRRENFQSYILWLAFFLCTKEKYKN